MKINPLILVTIITAMVKEIGVAERIAEIADNEALLSKQANRPYDVKGTIKSVKDLTDVTITEAALAEVLNNKSTFKLNFVANLVTDLVKKFNANIPVDLINGIIGILVKVLFPKK